MRESISEKARAAAARPAPRRGRRPTGMLQLQRAVGNRAVTRLLRRAPERYPGAPTKGGEAAPGTEVSSELSDAPAASTPAERVFKWLVARAKHIGEQEARFGVDRRAIAGAIAWEALENPRGAFAHAGGRFVGAGKPHVKQGYGPAALSTGENVPQEVEEAGLLPRRSLAERELALYRDSIPYIAAGMRLASDIARKYGRDISRDPAMLTWFWQTKDATTFIDYWSKKRGSTFDPTAERMPKWVVENLGWLTAAVGASQLPLQGASPRAGTMETESWKGSYGMEARLPETRQFLVTGGAVTVTLSAYSEIVAANGYDVWLVLHRRHGGSDAEVGDARRAKIGRETKVTWSDLADGLYFLEIFSHHGVRVEGELDVELPARAPAVQRQVDAGAEPDALTAPDPGALRAAAARLLVHQLQAKKAVYGHETIASGGAVMRREGWWWNETEFDCSKFVLWVLAGRHTGDPAPAEGTRGKAIRGVETQPFGRVVDASSVASMIEIAKALAREGKSGPIDTARTPRVGDLMFWDGHVAIVVELQPAQGGGTWIVYANMGVTGAGLVGVDAKGRHWLKVDEIAGRRKLASGAWLGFWSP